jgi:hypothetical protein
LATRQFVSIYCGPDDGTVVAVLPAFLKIDGNQFTLGKLVGRGGTCDVHEVFLNDNADLPDAVKDAAQGANRMVIKVLTGKLHRCPHLCPSM